MKLKCSLCGTAYEFIYIKNEPLPPNFPFCSNRCKAIDLGKWLNEEYRINTPLAETETALTEVDRNMLAESQEEALTQLFGDDCGVKKLMSTDLAHAFDVDYSL